MNLNEHDQNRRINNADHAIGILSVLFSFDDMICITCVGITPTRCNARASSLFLGISINKSFIYVKEK